MISEFRNEYYFLSNFFPQEIIFEGIKFQNNEAAFQSCKLADINERRIFENLDPSAAKNLGRKVHLRPDWELVKDEYMYQICRTKFAIPQMRDLLIATEGHMLTEGNWWHDNYWGACYCEKCKNKLHQNTLGEILMRVRNNLISNIQ